MKLTTYNEIAEQIEKDLKNKTNMNDDEIIAAIDELYGYESKSSNAYEDEAYAARENGFEEVAELYDLLIEKWYEVEK